eukprot:Nitzschia sp. Nitz4//scaffold39_size137210//108493//109545//NITZ4_003217-RA/size137210-processed-gene-0.99-mRNA-1//1//CDS//3329550437//8699//frame0
MTNLLDFAVITIFAREVLEGGIIIGEYRTVILRSDWSNADFTQQQALRAITVASVFAAAFAVIVCAATAIPLAVLSKDFNDKTAMLIEGTSKIVASACILGLSLKMPKFFGLYYSKKQVQQLKNGENIEEHDTHGLTLRSIRFNVAWNIWREVAECGAFLIPSFLTGEGIKAIPLSAVVGCVAGAAICGAIYIANQRMKDVVGLTVFTVGLLLLLSAGLFEGGCHEFEEVYGMTPTVWHLHGDFWSVDRLPMTIFKPFGYSDHRTVLQMVTFWVWIIVGLALHWRKYKACRKSLLNPAELAIKTENTGVQDSDECTPVVSSLDEECGDSTASRYSIQERLDLELGSDNKS